MIFTGQSVVKLDNTHFGIVGQKRVDERVYPGEAFIDCREVEQFSYRQYLSSVHYGFGVVVDYHIAIGRVAFAEEYEVYAEFSLQFCCQLGPVRA